VETEYVEVFSFKPVKDERFRLTVAEKDGVLTFPTAAGATYVVDRPDDPWEARPVTVISQLPH
jgi:hypothetical protein